MIPQDKNQPGPAGVVKMFGHPWHGLVEDGTLTLPNAATMPYPAPTAAGEADVLAFVVPGTPAVVRTPAQAAADAAAGRQWLDYALISGRTTRRLYGQPIGGNGSWLYAAPDGSRWLATLAGVPGTHDLTAPWSTTVTFDRFGAFGTPPEQHVLAVTLADWQQTLPVDPAEPYFLDGFWGEVTNAKVEMEDVRRDGSAALLCVQMDMNAFAWAFITDKEPIKRLLIGTIEMTLTGTPGVDAAAALTVRHSRAAMLGTLSWSETPDYVRYYHAYIGDGSPGTTWFWTADPEDPGVDGFSGAQAAVGSRTGAASHTGRVMAVGYDAIGQLREITLDITEQWSSSEPLPPDVENPTRVSSGTKTVTFTLTGPAGSFSIDGTLSETTQSTWTNFTVANTTISDVTLGPLAATWTAQFADAIPPYTMSPTSLGRLRAIDQSGGVFVTGAWPLAQPIALGGSPFEEWAVGVRRYSATCLELVAARALNSFFVEWHHFGALSIIGAAPGLQSFYAFPVRESGSAHPVTGDIARVRDVPVCWV